MWILYPIVYPTAKLLDWILGHEHGVIYKRAELKELVKVTPGYLFFSCMEKVLKEL
jgi:hypothetical protein